MSWRKKQQQAEADYLLFKAFYSEATSLEEAEAATGLHYRIIGEWAEKALREGRLLSCFVFQDSVTGERTTYFTTNKTVFLKWKIHAAGIRARDQVRHLRLN